MPTIDLLSKSYGASDKRSIQIKAMSEPGKQKLIDIPAEVAHAFLSTLEEKKIESAVVERLRVLLLSGEKLSRKDFNDALFDEDPLP